MKRSFTRPVWQTRYPFSFQRNDRFWQWIQRFKEENRYQHQEYINMKVFTILATIIVVWIAAFVTAQNDPDDMCCSRNGDYRVCDPRCWSTKISNGKFKLVSNNTNKKMEFLTTHRIRDCFLYIFFFEIYEYIMILDCLVNCIFNQISNRVQIKLKKYQNIHLKCVSMCVCFIFSF